MCSSFTIEEYKSLKRMTSLTYVYYVPMLNSRNTTVKLSKYDSLPEKCYDIEGLEVFFLAIAFSNPTFKLEKLLQIRIIDAFTMNSSIHLLKQFTILESLVECFNVLLQDSQTHYFTKRDHTWTQSGIVVFLILHQQTNHLTVDVCIIKRQRLLKRVLAVSINSLHRVGLDQRVR